MSTMSYCFLIVGGNLQLRVKKAEDKFGPFQNNPDLLILESETLIGIEQIRQLQTQLSLKPFREKFKSAIIPRAENLTPEAQNALLKTLEEPPENTVIILCAPDPSWLLPTIVSRCQIIQLPLTPQISLTEKEEKEFLEIFKKITSGKIGERWEALEKLGIHQDRTKAIEWVDKMIFLVRKLLIENYPKNPEYFNVLKSLFNTKTYLQSNTNIRLTLENFVLNLSFFGR